MKIAVFGKTGQVARALQRLNLDGTEVVAMGRDVVDFNDPAAVADATHAVDADAIINAVAYTAVDQAETDRETADRVNAQSVGAMARVAAERALPLVHISTDYVFDGSGNTPWSPDASPGPLGIYGATKLAGEDAVRAVGGRFAILRTSWVFSADGSNFVKTMLRLSETRGELTVVADQIGGPTSARAIGTACVTLARSLSQSGSSGTYHFAGAPDVSWAAFAREIFRQADRAVTVHDIPTTDYPTPAPRPLNSRLDCESLMREHGIARPDWRDDLAQVLKDLS